MSDILASRPGLRRTVTGCWFDPEDPGEPGYPDTRQRWSVSARERQILAALARGQRVLEVGTGLGISTEAMAETAHNVVTIDPDPWVAENIVPHLPGNVVHVDRALDVPGGECFGLVFIDGLHSPEAVADDIALAELVLAKPGVIVLHDGRMPVVQEGIEKSGIDLSAAYPMETESGLVLIVLGEE